MIVLGLAFEGVPSLVLDVAMTWLVVAVCLRPDHLLRRGLANAAMRYVGTISYGMYLMHMLAMNAVRRTLPDAGSLVRFVGASALAIAVASASYYLFEKRILDFKDRIGGKRRALVAAPARVSPADG
ncbi:MAG: acyltransferase [Deltaproteobacteria bacterium]|nr:acyltransferase [Deltaproteobacteria bacterium]